MSKERLYYPKDKSKIEEILKKRREEFKDLSWRVKDIIEDVKTRGDIACKEYIKVWDKAEIEEIRTSEEEIEEAYIKTKEELEPLLDFAFSKIEPLLKLQKDRLEDITYAHEDEFTLKLKYLPVESVGIYVPGGEAPLFSSLYMAAIPAKLAGVNRIAVATPPSKGGKINPYILATAKKLGIKEVYKLSGVLAVGAFTYGTESVPKVDKIVGPGSAYFNAAKRVVWGEVGVDFIAADTEIVVFADDSTPPSIIEAELKAQKEHSINTQSVLVTTSKSLEGIELTVEVRNEEEGIEFINLFAPEHLVLLVKEPNKYLTKIKNVGCISVGIHTPSVLVDYVSGVNHIIPTLQGAKFFSPLSIYDFVKFYYLVEYKPGETLAEAKKYALKLAKLEGLNNHANRLLQ